jgi:hypothetical protein
LLTLHDKQTKSFDPPILSSSSSSDDENWYFDNDRHICETRREHIFLCP